MGNIIGTVRYDPVSHDRFGHIICDVREKYRLDPASPVNLNVIHNKRMDGAEIGKHWFAIYGQAACRKMMQDFLKDCKWRLEQAGATGVETLLDEQST